MRRAMIMIFVLFNMMPAIQSQDNGFPLCSAAELAYVLGMQTEFDKLIDSVLSDEASPDFLVDYSAAQIEWRGELWADLPPCAEAIETAALLSETTSDIAAAAALTFAGVPLSANPYQAREAAEGVAYDILDSHFQSISALADSGEPPAEPEAGERSLRECVTLDIETLIGVVRESEDLIVSGVDARSLEALVDYAAAMLTWRDGVWAQLTPCAEAIHLGILMSQTASDIVTAFAFSFAGVPAAENPCSELLSEELTELAVTLQALIVLTSAAGDASVAAPLENPLPACSAHDMAAVADMLSPISDLGKEALSMESSEDLLVYIGKMMDWREALWSSVPLCAESVEISLVATNVASDLAAALALVFAGKSVDETPFWLSSLEGLQAVILWTSEKQAGADGSQASAQSESLPQCTDAEREALKANVEQVILFSHLIGEIETLDDLLSFGEGQMTVRHVLWKQQPPCQEAIRGAQLIIQLTGDAVPAFALIMFAGVPTDDILYISAIGSTQERVRAFAAAFDGD